MSHPTDWDVDSYRTSHESEEHWQLRKRFMERWKDNFPEDRLVCLARVFANIEFLGCRYPAKVMALVAELSKEVAYDYRESRKTKIHRTFVSASDAAGDKAKGIKRSANEHGSSEPPSKKMFVPAQESKPVNESNREVQKNFKFDYGNRFQKASDDCDQKEHNDNSNDLCFARPSFSQNQDWQPPNQRSNQNTKWANQSQRPSFEVSNNRNSRKQNQPNPKFQGNVNSRNSNPKYSDHNHLISSEYGQLVLYDRGGTFHNNLIGSCQTSKVSFDAEYKQGNTDWKCSVKLNNIFVSSAQGFSQKEAKEAACKVAWEKLQKKLYTLVVKQRHTSKKDSVISVQDISSTKEMKNDSLIDGLDTKVDSAIATRMMQMMGWKGGALGSAGDGISEPIQPNLKQIRRAGLGSEVGNEETCIRDAVRRTIREFAHNGDADYDLVFASDFTKDERAVMHKLAQGMNLKSKSYGKDDDRYIVISKPISAGQLVKSLLDSGGSNQKYDLISPSK